ncbi:MAG TPA: hypothetical protein VGP35_03105 [Terriglobales bacterium]|jgi:hypothetical protein|nr:hypothetical protein [Terriglobales bacterium]
MYADAVEDAFDADIDYALLVKLYGASSENPESRYSPATCIGCRTGVLAEFLIRRNCEKVNGDRENKMCLFSP